MRNGAEFLIDKPISTRAERFLRAIFNGAPEGSRITNEYQGSHRILVIYGPGKDYRKAAMAKHRAAGGMVVGFDMAYWDREDSMRLFINDQHPNARQLDATPSMPRRPIQLREDCDPNGPIMLVGLGNKTVRSLAAHPMAWELEALDRIKARWPNRRVIWRPKGPTVTTIPGTALSFGNKIEAALKGCSLVVCRHSNVAVDACVAGIPVICEAGAAFWLYSKGQNPSREEREDFLGRLTWWEWSKSESKGLWQWVAAISA